MEVEGEEEGRQTCSISMLLGVIPLLLLKSGPCLGLLLITSINSSSSNSSNSSSPGATHLRRQGVGGCEAKDGREGGREGKKVWTPNRVCYNVVHRPWREEKRVRRGEEIG